MYNYLDEFDQYDFSSSIEGKLEIVVPAIVERKRSFDPCGEESTFHFVTDHSIIFPTETTN